jgi:hypothetical protein
MKKMNAIEVKWNNSEENMNTKKNITQGIKYNNNEAGAKKKQ